MRNRWLIFLILINLFDVNQAFASGSCFDGGSGVLRAAHPLTVGRGKLGMGLSFDYSAFSLRNDYIGEYYITTNACLTYGLFDEVDLKLYFPYYVDVLDDFRYGAGDLHFGVKYAPEFLHLSSWHNSLQFHAIFPTGFKADPLFGQYIFLRPYSYEKFGYVISWLTEFSHEKFSLIANIGFMGIPRSDSLMFKDQTLVRQGYGFTSINESRSAGTFCPQFPFVFSLSYQLFRKFIPFLQISGSMLRPQVANINDPMVITPGFELEFNKHLSLSAAIDIDLFETTPRYCGVTGINFKRDLFSVPIIIEEYPITPESVRRIAIVPFKDNPQHGFAQHMKQNLKNKILYTQDFDYIEDEIVNEAIKQNNISEEDLYLKAALVTIGRTVNAEYVISGKVLDDRYYTKDISVWRKIFGKKGVAYQNQVLLTIIIPESGEYVYNKVIDVETYLKVTKSFGTINSTDPSFFTTVDEKNQLFESNSDKAVAEIMKVFYQRFYNFDDLKVKTHLKNKGILKGE